MVIGSCIGLTVVDSIMLAVAGYSEERKMSDEANFLEFWTLYPRKVARAYAERCWKKLSPAYKQLALSEIAAHVEHWQKRNLSLELIPHASTWLNQRRWEDKLETSVSWIPGTDKGRKINGRAPLAQVQDGRDCADSASTPSIQTEEGIRKGLEACKAVLTRRSDCA